MNIVEYVKETLDLKIRNNKLVDLTIIELIQ